MDRPAREHCELIVALVIAGSFAACPGDRRSSPTTDGAAVSLEDRGELVVAATPAEVFAAFQADAGPSIERNGRPLAVTGTLVTVNRGPPGADAILIELEMSNASKPLRAVLEELDRAKSDRLEPGVRVTVVCRDGPHWLRAPGALQLQQCALR